MTEDTENTPPGAAHLADALMGLCLMASQSPRDGHRRLVAQFQKTYPEILVAGSALREIASIVNEWQAHDDPTANDEMVSILDLAEVVLGVAE